MAAIRSDIHPTRQILLPAALTCSGVWRLVNQNGFQQRGQIEFNILTLEMLMHFLQLIGHTTNLL